MVLAECAWTSAWGRIRASKNDRRAILRAETTKAGTMDEYERGRAMHRRREEMRTTSREEVLSILALAGLKPTRTWELANGYWPDAPDYDDVRYPWWLAQTSIGLIRIGRRKRLG